MIAFLGHCPSPTNDDRATNLADTYKTPGRTVSPGNYQGNSSHNGNPNPNLNVDFTPRAPAPPPRTKPLNKWCTEWNSFDGCIPITYKTPDPTEPADPAPDAPAAAIPSFTITDLATFAPAPATISGEPDNLGVAGLPVNFTTDATTHTRSGELFGFPITVRFTPASFTYHYGDGSTQSTSTPGSTWKKLHQADFTPTATSHTYRDRGTYTTTVDTAYTAEIDLGAGWFPITGSLKIPGAAQTVRIYEAHTALVARTCSEDPRAEGC